MGDNIYLTVDMLSIGYPPMGQIHIGVPDEDATARGSRCHVTTGSAAWFMTHADAMALIEKLKDDGWSCSTRPRIAVYQFYRLSAPPLRSP